MVFYSLKWIATKICLQNQILLMSEKLKEEIKYNTEWIRILMIWLFAMGTGGVSLIRNKGNAASDLLLMGGAVIFCVLLFSVIYLHYRNVNNLKKL